MTRLPTASEIIMKEIDYRLNRLKMTKRAVGKSLGYSEAGFRLILERLRSNPSAKIRLNNEGDRVYKNRSYSKENRE